jgi:diacylglycerol kinase family enzyme
MAGLLAVFAGFEREIWIEQCAATEGILVLRAPSPLPEVEYSRAERVHVRTETPLEIYADGEFVCETPAEISVVAGALRVIYSPSESLEL